MNGARKVALVHGWGGSGQATWIAAGWGRALEVAGFSPIAIDLPGHGPQGGATDPAAYGDLASDLARMLPGDLHGAVGFSLGTKLLLELEARAPGQRGRLVLGGIGDNLFAPEAAGPALLASLAGAPASLPAIAALMDYAARSGGDPACLAAVLRRPANPQLDETRLAAAIAPILIVNSRDDSIAMPDARLRTALPGAEYLQIDGCGHIGLTDDPRFRQAATAFLARA